MFHDIEEKVAVAFRAQLQSRFQLDLPVSLEQPKQAAFGELAVPIAFQLARTLKRAPRQIAEELIRDFTLDGVSHLEIAGNGYINVRLDRAAFALTLLHPPAPPPESGHSQPKIIVEHTNINPNKAAHIGHLRNAVLGDTFVRMLRARQRRVEVQNYIDNTGVQVADVVAGFHFFEKRSLAEVRALIQNPDIRFDFLCWDLYARISSHYKEQPESLAWRADTLHAIEAGTGELAELAHLVADTIVQAHVRTMFRLGIEYDVLPRESEILHLQFWATAFELLKQRQAIYFEDSGKNKGCWVMPAAAFKDVSSSNPAPTDATATADSPMRDDDKVIVRSNGTVTYVGKDIAYQLWKFGLLGKDFFYRPWSDYPDGHRLWSTTDQPTGQSTPAFGNATQVYNVIDSRQSYLQDVVVAGLRALGFNKQADASIHFSYEMVALSPRTCVELGIPLSEEDQRKPYVEVSGRKGLGVKADDLIDKLIESALAEVAHRNTSKSLAENKRTAEQIAIGALRYFMLKYTRNSVIAFDFQEALSFQGETGPYVQYAAVRASKILLEYVNRWGPLPDFATELTATAFAQGLADESLWQLLLLAGKSSSAVEAAIRSGEPAHVAKYAFQLAQGFSLFYHEVQVINEPDPARRTLLLWLTRFVHSQLLAALAVLGIEAPSYM